MKILHLIYDDINNPWLAGGGAFASYEINKRLAKKHEITVITGNYPGAKNIIKGGINYKRIGSSISYLLSRITYSKKLKNIIKNSDFDILIDDFSPFSPSYSYKYTKKPIICVLRNIFLDHSFKRFNLLGVIPYLTEKKAFKNYKNFLVFSPSMEEKLKTLTNSKITRLSRGINTKDYKPSKKEQDYILYLGRISIYQKGIDRLVKAFSEIKTNTKLIIAGYGTKKDIKELKELLKNKNIEFIGKVTGKKKTDLLSNCKFICMPSRYESWGTVAIEAAASQKPVIGTKITGLKDSIKNNQTGILIHPKNLKEAITELLKNKKLREKLGKNALNYSKTFDWDEIIKDYEKVYMNDHIIV